MIKILKNIYFKNYGTIWQSVYSLRQKIGITKAPYYVQWVSTHKCNLCCKHCGTNAGKQLKNELKTKKMEEVIKEMGEMGVNLFSVTGGEPLVRKDIFHLLNLAKDYGIKTGLVTNGILVKKFMKDLGKLDLFSIMVSIDGLKDFHNDFRGKNCFNKALESMKIFEELNVPIRSISTSINQKNINQLEEFKDTVFNSGAKHWRINLIIPEGRAKKFKWLFLTKDQMENVIKFIAENRKLFNIEICEGAGYLGKWDKKVRNSPFFCGCGWNTCTIMADGGIQGCPSFEKRFDEGNIKDRNFKEIWENEFTRFRKLGLPEDCEKCDYFNACRGGCWLMRIHKVNCFKEIWENL